MERGWPLFFLFAVKYQRNKSLTKREIETYWKSKKRDEEEPSNAISDLWPSNQVDATFKEYEDERRHQRSSSMPLPDIKENSLDMEIEEESKEKLIEKNGWWISSKWAFLNEPPVIKSEGPRYKYASQYHLTNTGAPKPHAMTGIST
ncbi:hypothetical protein RJ640_020963 [Escallonia rubra]|uniref:Uncharacterized protein n=1 Tax=Escallonia rubra TaxID=112253 RepID=A0AA88RQD8_9ASTE|nr:hypothetical protein RJ640_020963 [Escallonia rubra]